MQCRQTERQTDMQTELTDRKSLADRHTNRGAARQTSRRADDRQTGG